MNPPVAGIRLAAALLGLLLAPLALAEPLRLATSAYLAPYIDSDANSGPQLAIVREALGHAGYAIDDTLYTSNKRSVILLRSGQVDGAINVPHGLDGLVYSKPVIHYQNRAISRASDQLGIERVEDLLNYRVVGFQSARQFLGERYRNFMEHHPNYSEVANQQSQVELLLRGRTDVVVMDRNIFHHLKQSLEPALRAVEVTSHPILPETPHYVSFTDPALRDAFNRGLQHLIESGRYNELMAPLQEGHGCSNPARPETTATTRTPLTPCP